MEEIAAEMWPLQMCPSCCGGRRIRGSGCVFQVDTAGIDQRQESDGTQTFTSRRRIDSLLGHQKGGTYPIKSAHIQDT